MLDKSCMLSEDKLHFRHSYFKLTQQFHLFSFFIVIAVLGTEEIFRHKLVCRTMFMALLGWQYSEKYFIASLLFHRLIVFIAPKSSCVDHR